MKMIYDADHYCRTMYTKECRPSWEKAERLEYCDQDAKASKKSFLSNLFARI